MSVTKPKLSLEKLLHLLRKPEIATVNNIDAAIAFLCRLGVLR